VAYFLFAAQLVFVYNFFASLFRGARAPANPWEVGTLEWSATTSPPPPHNFDRIPTVLHGPHEFNHPAVTHKDWLGQTEPLPHLDKPSS
jgi:cytochrome c oxidase subunit 1